MTKIDFKNKKVIALFALFGISLISAGVFASASITLNSGNPVNLGAGAVAVSVCDQQATIAMDQTYDANSQSFKLTTISLQELDHSLCLGKTITMAFKDANGDTQSTTWSVGSTAGDLVWGGSAGTGNTSYSALDPVDTAGSNISTIAISAQ
jgi:uncharacterized protein (DUF2141 family)